MRESEKGFISHFVTNTGSLLVLTFTDLEVWKIEKWSEWYLRIKPLKSWYLFCIKRIFQNKFKLKSPRRYVIGFCFLYKITKIIFKIFFISWWLSVNSVNKNIFWFLVYYYKTNSFSILIIDTNIMSYIINQFLVNKNIPYDTTVCSAIFPDLMNTYIVWKWYIFLVCRLSDSVIHFI